MELDAETVGAWLERWGVEALAALVALVGGGAGLLAGDLLQTALAATVVVLVLDRVRLRMDNRSLAAFVREVRSRERETTGE